MEIGDASGDKKMRGFRPLPAAFVLSFRGILHGIGGQDRRKTVNNTNQNCRSRAVAPLAKANAEPILTETAMTLLTCALSASLFLATAPETAGEYPFAVKVSGTGQPMILIPVP